MVLIIKHGLGFVPATLPLDLPQSSNFENIFHLLGFGIASQANCNLVSEMIPSCKLSWTIEVVRGWGDHIRSKVPEVLFNNTWTRCSIDRLEQTCSMTMTMRILRSSSTSYLSVSLLYGESPFPIAKFLIIWRQTPLPQPMMTYELRTTILLVPWRFLEGLHGPFCMFIAKGGFGTNHPRHICFTRYRHKESNKARILILIARNV